MTASYVRPTSLGSIGRYGTCHRMSSTSASCSSADELHRVQALVDRVLVAAGERGVDQVAAVRMAFVYGQLVAVLDGAADLVDVGEVDLRVDAAGEQVEAQRDQADVAGALTVAEQAALDAVGAGLVAQFGCGDGGSAVVVRVQAQDDRVAAGQVAAHPLDRVGVHVGRRHLDGGGQVHDQRRTRGSAAMISATASHTSTWRTPVRCRCRTPGSTRSATACRGTSSPPRRTCARRRWRSS